MPAVSTAKINTTIFEGCFGATNEEIWLKILGKSCKSRQDIFKVATCLLIQTKSKVMTVWSWLYASANQPCRIDLFGVQMRSTKPSCRAINRALYNSFKGGSLSFSPSVFSNQRASKEAFLQAPTASSKARGHSSIIFNKELETSKGGYVLAFSFQSNEAFLHHLQPPSSSKSWRQLKGVATY